MKKAINVIICLSIVLSITSCDGNSGKPNSKSTTSQTSETLSVTSKSSTVQSKTESEAVISTDKNSNLSAQDTKLRFVNVTENIEIAVGEQRTISAYIMPPNVRHRTHVKITVDVSGIIEYDSSEYKGDIMEIKGISVGECTVTFKGPREDMIAKSKIIVKN
jgi:hypothetical protein